MATVYRELDVWAGVPPASGFARRDVIAGSNFPVRCLDFGASTDEAVIYPFRALNYGSGNWTIGIDWYADTASSGDVIWGAQLAAITPNSDLQDVETDTLATANTVTDSHLGTTGQRLHRAEITLSNLDSVAADDFVWLRIYRDADAGGDTLTGDASIVGLCVSYSDT